MLCGHSFVVLIDSCIATCLKIMTKSEKTAKYIWQAIKAVVLHYSLTTYTKIITYSYKTAKYGILKNIVNDKRPPRKLQYHNEKLRKFRLWNRSEKQLSHLMFTPDPWLAFLSSHQFLWHYQIVRVKKCWHCKCILEHWDIISLSITH